ncbi:hypothetical protein TWF694_004486 [Orbilia ellipsospora]|uniref:Peptidase S8/S53 domain-containing protein n=1 Tax=Orbilia ellipsospora TaxID=2528407 RepID=A0AAV9WVA1_9PEZI
MPIFSSISASKSVLLLLVVPVALAAPFDNFSSKRETGPSTQSDAPWHLARLTSTGPMLEGNDLQAGKPKTGDYKYPSSAGEGVDIYIVDTGVAIQANQNEFNGRASFLKGTIGDDGAIKLDKNGKPDPHGTKVAGMAGSASYGVAKKANIISVRDEDEFVGKIIEQHNKRKDQADFKGSVVNYSHGDLVTKEDIELDGRYYQKLIEQGIHVVMSAGNTAEDACGHAPSGANRYFPDFIAVGATDYRDWVWKNDDKSGSNFGDCVDIWAPGFNNPDINLEGHPLPNRISVFSQTSAAAGMTSGMIAVELSANPQFKLNPKGMKAHLLSIGFVGAVKDSNGNRMPRSILLGNKHLAGKQATSGPTARPPSESNGTSPNNGSSGTEPTANAPSSGTKSPGPASHLPKMRFITGSTVTAITFPGRAEEEFMEQHYIVQSFKGHKFQVEINKSLVTFNLCGPDMPAVAKETFMGIC